MRIPGEGLNKGAETLAEGREACGIGEPVENSMNISIGVDIGAAVKESAASGKWPKAGAVRICAGAETDLCPCPD